ncbi:hypothetical protein [Hylemonella gracilis]|uniref:hypothetical protein n=1 Tax=Hylemonella gracilis TaxID=80880 RepID=UPI0012DEC6AF|nr:hypothetical protein [Hylemonella gracilis]
MMLISPRDKPMDEGSPAKAKGIFGAADFAFAAKEIRQLLHLHPATSDDLPLNCWRITLI